VVRTPPSGEVVSLFDLVQTVKYDCHELADLSWVLPMLVVRDDESSWRNRFGTTQTMDALLRQHLNAERRCVACFGTHWSMALAVCVRIAPQKFSPRVRHDAEMRLTEAVETARLDQMPSGEFSLPLPVQATSTQSEPGTFAQPSALNSAEVSLTMQAHTLEWLCVAVSDQCLQNDKWVHVGMCRLIAQIDQCHTVSYDIYAHASRAMRLYEERMSRHDN